MSTLFPVPNEKRYADYPRRYGMEYFVDARRKVPNVKSGCATLFSARKRANNACDLGYCSVVRIFDHKTGRYLYTYRATDAGTLRHEGFVRS